MRKVLISEEGATELITTAVALPVLILLVVGAVGVARPMLISNDLKSAVKSAAAVASEEPAAGEGQENLQVSAACDTAKDKLSKSIMSPGKFSFEFAIVKAEAGPGVPVPKQEVTYLDCGGQGADVGWKDIYNSQVRTKLGANENPTLLIGVGHTKVSGFAGGVFGGESELIEYVITPIADYQPQHTNGIGIVLSQNRPGGGGGGVSGGDGGGSSGAGGSTGSSGGSTGGESGCVFLDNCDPTGGGEKKS